MDVKGVSILLPSGILHSNNSLSPPVLMHGGLICITLGLYNKLLDTNSLDINSYLENYNA